MNASYEAGREANEEGLPREVPNQYDQAEWLRGWDEQQVVREQWYELHE